jgi:hypothetical protein
MIIHNVFKLSQKTNRRVDQALGYYHQYERFFATVPNPRKEETKEELLVKQILYKIAKKWQSISGIPSINTAEESASQKTYKPGPVN